MFEDWLRLVLKDKRIDNVYHNYLISILEDNIDEDEKRETVTDIINSLIEHDTEIFINNIFDKWTETHGKAQTSNGGVKKQEEVDIAKLLESQAKLVTVKQNREISEEQRKIKEQILANYSQCSDKEDDDDEEGGAAGGGGGGGEESDNDPDLEKNTNKADVAKLAKEKREQARMESAAKKQKDKEDRAKQKATREEKKANRKAAAVKGERKR